MYKGNPVIKSQDLSAGGFSDICYFGAINELEMDEESIKCIFPYWELETGKIIINPSRLFEFFPN
jgi:hypothetical protein